MWSFEREVPLKACSFMSCRRDHTCHVLASGGHCAKTHYSNHDEFCDELTARIHELSKEGDPDPATRYLTGEARAAAVYQALRNSLPEFGGKG